MDKTFAELGSLNLLPQVLSLQFFLSNHETLESVPYLQCLSTGDDRIICIKISLGQRKIIFINMYVNIMYSIFGYIQSGSVGEGTL